MSIWLPSGGACWMTAPVADLVKSGVTPPACGAAGLPPPGPGRTSPPVPSVNRGFHVYVLQLRGGDFLAGYSRDLRVRLMEHRDGVIPPTAGRSPELVWFTLVESRAEAKALKVRLRRLCDDDPREMRRWVIRFQDLVRELNVC